MLQIDNYVSILKILWKQIKEAYFSLYSIS